MKLIMRLVATVAFMMLYAASWAQLDYYTMVDSDNNQATGCAVTLPTSGTVAGIERRLTASVSETAAPQVTQLALESCVGGIFGAPATLPGAPYPAGSNNGTGGADAVELAVSVGAIAAPGATVRLYFAAQGPTSDDLLGATSGPPFLFDIQPGGGPADIPFLSGPGFLVLALLLLGVVLWQRSRLPGSVVGVLLVGTLVGIAWAAGFRLDGQVDDWQGVSAVGSDAQGDSAPNTDIVAAFAAQEGGNLFFRTDIANAETTPSSNRAPSFTSTPVTAASVASPYSYAIASSDPDGNALTLTAPTLPAWLTFAPGNNGTGTLSGTPGPADLGPHAVVLRVTDNGIPSLSTDQTFTVTVGAAANPAPVLDLNGPVAGIDFAATFTEGGRAVAIVDSSNLTVIDPDSLNLASATVTLTNPLDAGQETLAVSAATVAPNAPITAAYNAATGVLALTGSAPLAQYQAALRTVTYINSAAAPTATPARVITFVVSDGSNTSAVATATVTLAGVNDAPSFTKGPDQTVLEDAGPQTVTGWATAISAGPPDEAGQTLTFNVTGNSNPGLFAAGPAVAGDGTLTYTLAANANGSATITLTLSDNGGTANGGVDTSAPQTFTLTVTPINDVPSFTKGPNQSVAENAGAQTVNGWGTAISPGPADEAGQTLTFTVSNDNNALFSAQPALSAAGVLTYTPAAGQSGSANGTVTVQDNGGTANGGVDTSAPQTFTITVNPVDDPPTAVNDTATVAEDAAATTIDVLLNDTDPDGGPKSIASVTQPANGTVIITNGGANLTYQPAPNYCNSPPGTTLDSFTYALTPGGSTGTVTVTVNCDNDGPVVDLDADDNQGTGGSDFAATFTEGGPAILLEDPTDATVTDVDNTTLASLTVTLTNLLDTGFETLAANVTGTSITANYVAATGVLTLTGPDTITNFQTVLRTVGYLNSDNAPDTTPRVIQFVANDGTANGNVAIATVTISAVDGNPTAVADAATVGEDAPASTINVLANDTDADGGPISISSVTQPANGTVVVTGGGTGLTYRPNANYCNNPPGTTLDTFSYALAPGGSSATVTVTVTCVDDPPVSVNDAATVNEDSGANAISVLANDTDADGGPISITSVTQPANGAVVITGGGTGLTYAPNANYCNNPPGTTPDTFIYTLTPGGSTATVSVTVTCLNDPPSVTPPVAYAAQAHIGIDIPDGPTDLLDGSTIADVDGAGGAPFSLGTTGAIATANGGAATISANGSFSYNPPAGFTGNDTFTYQICDSGVPAPSACTNATATVAVSGPRVWFVNNALGAAGDGRFSNPFNTLAAADTAANVNGDRIFVFTGSSTYTGGFTLQDSQRLVGQGVVDTGFDAALGITPPANSVTRPAINGTRPTITGTIALAPSVTARGFNVSNTTVNGVTGTGATGLTVNQVSVTTTTGTAVNLANSGGTVSFTSVSANGGANGIVLNNTTGSFAVTGTGTAGSGGTIQNTTSDGILLTNTQNVNLSSMNIQNANEDGIFGTTVAGLDLSGLSITNNGDDSEDVGIRVSNLSGSATWTNLTVTGSELANVIVENTTGTLSAFNISGGSYSNLGTAFGGNSILLNIRGAAILASGSISNASFLNNQPARALTIQAQENGRIGDASNSLTVQNNTFTNNGIQASFEAGPVPGGTLTYRFIDNGTAVTPMTMTGPGPGTSHALNVASSSQTTTGTLRGRFQNNFIGNAAVAASGSPIGNGVRAFIQGLTTGILLLDGNTVRQAGAARGIESTFLGPTTSAAAPAGDMTITNNDVDHRCLAAIPPCGAGSDFPLAAIYGAADSQGGGAVTARFDVRGNTVPSGGTVFDLFNANLIVDEVVSAASAQIVDTAPASANCTAQLTSTNTGSAEANTGCALIAGPINTPP